MNQDWPKGNPETSGLEAGIGRLRAETSGFHLSFTPKSIPHAGKSKNIHISAQH